MFSDILLTFWTTFLLITKLKILALLHSPGRTSVLIRLPTDNSAPYECKSILHIALYLL